jgi:hypothetical protein
MTLAHVMIAPFHFRGGFMDRRGFIKALFKGGACLPLVPMVAMARPSRQIIVQQSPIAGFQYYAGDELFPELWVDTPLLLVREQDNKYDTNAVAVHYKQYKLGFVPRADNTAVAQMLDRGEWLSARVVELTMSQNTWDRVRFEVVLDG